jgi:hypothetical protein
MLRILRAFAWLRWRMLINSLERTGSRDTLERFSIAAEQLGPIVAALVIVPSLLGLGGLSAAAGYSLTRADDGSVLLLALRYILFLLPIAAMLGPLFLPAGDRMNPVRMLLLPIPNATLYAAQAAATIGEPWIVLVVPIALALPIGLAAGGELAAALVALAGGALLIVALTGIAALATTVLHLAVRDRRRAEILGVVFILVISLAGLLPALIQGRSERGPDGRRTRRDIVLPTGVEQTGRRVIAATPGELYIRTARDAAAARYGDAAPRLLGLAALAALVHALGLLAYGKVLEGPGSSTARQGRADADRWGRTLPGLSPGASAVALGHLRLAMRTTRGRTILISPLLMLATFGVLTMRGGGMDFGSFRLEGGIALASFTSFVALVSMLPIAMNQFAVDGPGLTLSLLSPLPERDLLVGKAAGNALIAIPGSWLCVAGSYLLLPGGSPGVWLSIPVAMVATYVVVAPAAAVFSAIFPRVVDLSSIGGRGNAHGLAGLFGLLAFGVAGLPPVFLIVVAARWLERPALAPLLVLGWTAAAFALAAVLFRLVAQPVFAARRENLAMVVSRLLSPS